MVAFRVSGSDFVTTPSPTQPTPCVNCRTNLNLKNYAVAKLNHLPGREREMAVTVAYQKQYRKPGGFRVGGGDTIPLLRESSDRVSTAFAIFSTHARSYHRVTGWLAVGLRDRYRTGGRDIFISGLNRRPGESDRSLVLLRIGNIQRTISKRTSGPDSAITRFEQMSTALLLLGLGRLDQDSLEIELSARSWPRQRVHNRFDPPGFRGGVKLRNAAHRLPPRETGSPDHPSTHRPRSS